VAVGLLVEILQRRTEAEMVLRRPSQGAIEERARLRLMMEKRETAEEYQTNAGKEERRRSRWKGKTEKTEVDQD
jgi:hypothetical protein